MKALLLCGVMAVLATGCATYYDDDYAASNRNIDAYGAPGYDVGYAQGGSEAPPDMIPRVYGYENPVLQRSLGIRPSYGMGPMEWTGVFMPDYVRSGSTIGQ